MVSTKSWGKDLTSVSELLLKAAAGNEADESRERTRTVKLQAARTAKTEPDKLVDNTFTLKIKISVSAAFKQELSILLLYNL